VSFRVEPQALRTYTGHLAEGQHVGAGTAANITLRNEVRSSSARPGVRTCR
jgi:hypothetical protein